MPYNISEMLFNYNKCECCKYKMTDLSLTLYYILPANISNTISEYNIYCNQCYITRDLEKFFVEEYKDKGYI